MPNLSFDEKAWNKDRIMAPSEGDTDPADEVLRTNSQGFGDAETAGKESGSPDDSGGKPPDESRKGNRTMTIRVKMDLDLYIRLRTYGWIQDKQVSQIITDLLEEHLPDQPK